MKKQLKRLDLTKSTFEANGNKYIIEAELCMDRYIEFEKLQLELGFDITLDGFYDLLKNLYGLINDQKFLDAGVRVYDALTRIKNGIETRNHPMFYLCALFINREDEDRTVLEPELMNSKIEDWRKEGYAVNDFFTLAFNLVNNYIEIYQDVLKNILKNVQKEATRPKNRSSKSKT